MKYRDHRGGLIESLKTVQEISTLKQLKQHLNNSYKDFGFKVKDVKFEYAGMDSRIGWDTYYVMRRLHGQKEFAVAGMSDGVLIEKEAMKQKLKEGDVVMIEWTGNYPETTQMKKYSGKIGTILFEINDSYLVNFERDRQYFWNKDSLHYIGTL